MDLQELQSEMDGYTKLKNISEYGNGPNYTHQNGSDYIPDSNFQHTPKYIVSYVSIINVIIFIVGVTGNVLVILVVLCIKKMRTPTNYFLFTLSIADLLLLLVCQPVALMEFYLKERWFIGPVMCKLVPLLENGMLHVSILTMLAMTAERFYAIIYPFKKRASCSTRLTIKVIIALWVFAYCCTSPFLFITTLEDADFYDGSKIKVCRTLVYLPWHKIFVLTNTVVFFIIPLFVIVFMYSRIIQQLMTDSILVDAKNDQRSNRRHRSRKQVVRMLIFIICLFFVTMCPVRSVTLWLIYASTESIGNLGIEGYYNVIWFARIMMYINSAGNPIIYCLTSSKFKMAFKRILQKAHPCGRRQDQERKQQTATTRVLFKPSTKKKMLEAYDDEDDSDEASQTDTHTQNKDSIVIRIKYRAAS